MDASASRKEVLVYVWTQERDPQTGFVTQNYKDRDSSAIDVVNHITAKASGSRFVNELERADVAIDITGRQRGAQDSDWHIIHLRLVAGEHVTTIDAQDEDDWIGVAKTACRQIREWAAANCDQLVGQRKT